MSTFYYDGTKVHVFKEGQIEISDTLKPDFYTIKFDMDKFTFYLDKTEPFVIEEKIYGDTDSKINRILNTFSNRNKQTGILLSGAKGMGKSLLLKKLAIECIKKEIPVITVNELFVGEVFNSFIQDLSSKPICIIFDEFEKVYYKESKEEGYNGNNNQNSNIGKPVTVQAKLLTLLDGVVKSNTLFLFSVNDLSKIDSHFINRPGRVYYHIKYEQLENSTVKEFCRDNLNDESKIEEIIALNAILPLNFDILKTLTTEINTYGESVKECLNWLNIDLEAEINLYNIKIYDKDLSLIKNEIEAINIFYPFDVDIFSIAHVDTSKRIYLDIKEYRIMNHRDKDKYTTDWDNKTVFPTDLSKFEGNKMIYKVKYESTEQCTDYFTIEVMKSNLNNFSLIKNFRK